MLNVGQMTGYEYFFMYAVLRISYHILEDLEFMLFPGPFSTQWDLSDYYFRFGFYPLFLLSVRRIPLFV